MNCFYVKDYNHAKKIFTEFQKEYDKTTEVIESCPIIGKKSITLKWKCGTGDCGFNLKCFNDFHYARYDNNALKVFVTFWADVSEDSCVEPKDIQLYIEKVKKRSFFEKWNGNKWIWVRGDEDISEEK